MATLVNRSQRSLRKEQVSLSLSCPFLRISDLANRSKALLPPKFSLLTDEKSTFPPITATTWTAVAPMHTTKEVSLSYRAILQSTSQKYAKRASTPTITLSTQQHSKNCSRNALRQWWGLAKGSEIIKGARSRRPGRTNSPNKQSLHCSRREKCRTRFLSQGLLQLLRAIYNWSQLVFTKPLMGSSALLASLFFEICGRKTSSGPSGLQSYPALIFSDPQSMRSVFCLSPSNCTSLRLVGRSSLRGQGRGLRSLARYLVGSTSIQLFISIYLYPAKQPPFAPSTAYALIERSVQAMEQCQI